MALSIQRPSILVGLVAVVLLLQGACSMTLCGAPFNGACSSPDFCHYENYLDPATGKPVQKCLSCPNGSSIAWVGKVGSAPTPECIYSNVELGGACDSAFIAYTHSNDGTSAACYDQCKTTDNVAFDTEGNPTGCKQPEESRRLSSVVQCATPVSGACADPDNCHYENFLDAKTGEVVVECLSCPNGSSIAWTGEDSSPAPECIYSNVVVGAACDPPFIAYTHSNCKTTAACYDQCRTTDNIAYGADGNPTGCKSGRRLRR